MKRWIIFKALTFILLLGSTLAQAIAISSEAFIEKNVKVSEIYDLQDIEFEIVDHFIPTRSYLKVMKIQ